MNREFDVMSSFLAEAPPCQAPHCRLYVADSLLCAEAGDGLFTAKLIPKGKARCRLHLK